jgi:WD40 repeat protein
MAEWSLKSGVQVKAYEISGSTVRTGVILPGGKAVVLALHNKGIQKLDVRTGVPIGRLAADAGNVNDLVISSSGELIGACDDGSIRIWDLDSLEEIASLRGHASAATCLAMLSEGEYLVSGSADQSLILWNLKDRCKTRRFQGHQDGIYDVAILPDRGSIVSVSNDTSIRVWDFNKGESTTILGESHKPVIGVGILAEGNVVVAAADNQIEAYWIDTGEELAKYNVEASFQCLAVKDNSSAIIAGDELGRTHILKWMDFRGKRE